MTECGSRDFLFTMAIAYKSFLFGKLKFELIDRLPTSCIPLYYSETEKPRHLSLQLLCLKSAAKHSHHCQCKQVLRNYLLSDHNGTVSLNDRIG